MGEPSERACADCGVPLLRMGKSWPQRCPEHRELRRITLTRQRATAWAEANRDRYLARMRGYAEAHRAELAEKAKAWYESNPGRVSLYREATKDHKRRYNASYYAGNRDKEIARSLAYARTRGAQAKKARDSFRYAVRKGSPERPAERFALDEIYERDEHICHLCGLLADRSEASIDHLTPVSLGGLHTRANVKLAHRSCNARKGNRM